QDVGPRLDLDQGHDAVGLDLADDAREPVPSGEPRAGLHDGRTATEPLHLGHRHQPAVRRVPHAPDAAGPVPPPQRVQADPQGPGGVAPLEEAVLIPAWLPHEAYDMPQLRLGATAIGPSRRYPPRVPF